MTGHPVESVVITGPNSLSLNCLTAQSSGDVSCTKSNNDVVVEITSFAVGEAGTYTCTVKTSYWRDDTTEVANTADPTVALAYGWLLNCNQNKIGNCFLFKTYCCRTISIKRLAL